jgi:mannitol-specific phosphotransferase system IIBC component
MRKISLTGPSITVPVIPLILIMIAVAFPVLYVYAQGQVSPSTPGTVTTNTDTAGSLASAINSIAVIVGVIVPLIVSGAAYVKSKSQDPRIQEAADTAMHVGRIATATANKALENKEHIKEILEVGVALAPEDAKRVLAENQARIDQLNKEIQATTAQIKRLAANVPGYANADTIADLPRETPPTTPTR